MSSGAQSRAGAPVHGLVMAGGFSRRMGQDKALLSYHGVPQVLWTYRLLQQVCPQVWIGCRAGQDLGPANEVQRIEDRAPHRGPMEGIAAALAKDPQSAWLVVACDLPRLSAADLAGLLRERNPQALATVYRSAHDGLPEPLCALYEPGIQPLLETCLREQRNCPRKMLMGAADRVQLLEAPKSGALDNVNTPEEAEALQAEALRAPKKQIHLQYFAILREQAQCSNETVVTEAPDAGALYIELAARHGFSLDRTHIRVACDNKYQGMDTPLIDGMRLTFIPPVAGG